jgi:hypothetical protein
VGCGWVQLVSVVVRQYAVRRSLRLTWERTRRAEASNARYKPQLPINISMSALGLLPPPQSSSSMAFPLLAASHALAEAHHAQYDSSHDIHHVNRVVSLSLALARTLPAVDLLVVELAARFHDLLDAKYMPAGVPVPSARDHLRSFWDANDTEGETSGEQRALVEKVMENVSYSKEVKRIKAGAVTDWHRECLELHW